MVSDVRSRDRQESSANDSRDRGQIILIGAITLAFIVLGIVVVFNGILYTEALSSGSSSQSELDTNTIEYELGAGVGGLAHQGNLEWSAENRSDYESDMTAATEGFDETYLNSKANSRPETARIEFIEVDEDATVVRDKSIDPLEIDIDNQIGHLEYKLESGGEDGELEIEVESGGNSENLIFVESNGAFEVDYEGNTCAIDHDEPRVDLVTGDVLVPTDNDCDVSLIDPTTEYDTIAVDNANGNISGTYDLVTKGEEDLGLADEHHGAWSVEVRITYESHDVSYGQTKTVDIYEERQ
ncbi:MULTISPECIES: hypothetical protein [Natrialbaceae]|uniref:hypothetical protein n=1 Tax=Natrialbaceae TaxID=1644061 RepID=UPI00207C55BE|nr:hypothetical protein [Natronococcus sp. CG52]